MSRLTWMLMWVAFDQLQDPQFIVKKRLCPANTERDAATAKVSTLCWGLPLEIDMPI
jgi:hypothetical protein